MSNIVTRLERLKSDIADDEKELIQAETKKDMLLQDLKNEFGLKSLNEAEEALTDLSAEETNLLQLIENELDALEQQYDAR